MAEKSLNALTSGAFRTGSGRSFYTQAGHPAIKRMSSYPRTFSADNKNIATGGGLSLQ
jgi:hypothetical protein